LIENQTLKDLDYFKVLSVIEEFTNSEATKKSINKIYPFESFEEAENSLKEFVDLKEFIDKGGQLPVSPFPDVYPLIERAEKKELS